jgi:hypothetical protein
MLFELIVIIFWTDYLCYKTRQKTTTKSKQQPIQKTLFPLDLFADIMFFLDLIKHFFCGYIDEFDYAIMDFAKVYMTSPSLLC